jgi:hypothetical protein
MPTLIEMATDPKWCSNAHIDPILSVPEIVLFCVRYLQRMDHVPGLLLVHLKSPLVDKIQSEFVTGGKFPDPEVDTSSDTAYAVAGVLYKFLCALPDPPIPYEAFKGFVNCAMIPTSLDESSSPKRVGMSPSMSPELREAIATAHVHAVERSDCKSALCRKYR